VRREIQPQGFYRKYLGALKATKTSRRCDHQARQEDFKKNEDVDFSAFSAILAVKRFTLIGRLMSSAAIFR